MKRFTLLLLLVCASPSFGQTQHFPFLSSSGSATSVSGQASGFATDPAYVVATGAVVTSNMLSVIISSAASGISFGSAGPSGYSTDTLFVTALPYKLSDCTIATYALVATNAVTQLSTLVPVATPPCIVLIQVSGKTYYAPTAMAAAGVPLGGQIMQYGDVISRGWATSTPNLQFQADPAGSPATVTVVVYPIQ